MRTLADLCVVGVAAATLAGCVSGPAMVGAPRAQLTPDEVVVYQTPPRHYERIALIQAASGGSWLFLRNNESGAAIAKLRRQAARLGANGVLIEGTTQQPSGGLGIGVGGFSFGRHSAFGASTGVGAPVMTERVQATAIYVNR